MGKLDGAIGYLSGSIEFAADHGVGWRKKFIALTKAKKLKIAYIDPTDKPTEEHIKLREDQSYQTTLQNNGNFFELKQYVHSYRHHDLRFVDYSDFIVIMVDPDIPQWGTGDETYMAESQHKPMFFICKGGLYKLPRWLFDVIQFKDEQWNVYETLEEVIEQLILRDNGTIPLDEDWIMIRKALRKALEAT